MKILILHNQLWSQYKSIVFEKISNYCLKYGDDLLVLQTSISESSRKDLIDFDVEKFKYKYKFKLLNSTFLEATNSFATTIKWLIQISQFKPDVVNLTGYSEPGTLVILSICKIFKIKTIITNESIYDRRDHHENFLFYLKKLYKIFLFYLTDYFFSYGLHSNDFLFRHHVDKRKILSFLNSFDTDRFKALPQSNDSISDKYFLFVGRLSSEKNIDFLVDFAIILKNNSSNINIKIIGNGPELNKLESIINTLQLTNIQMIGSVKWDNLGPFYSNSLGLILPSFFEPWGMVANEAFYYQIPVICSKFCGCSEDLIINGFNGIVIQDLNSFAKNFDSNNFLKNYLTIRKKFIENIKKTNHIFEPDRLGKELYMSFKKVA
jgi:glycosyltransferase involved in cell wall biosynthesis